MIVRMPDEDVFARLPRVFRGACHALRDGLRSGLCDPYPLALGLEQLVARAGGVPVLPALLAVFPDSADSSQVLLPIQHDAELDRVDRIAQKRGQTRLDQLASRVAQRQLIKGDLGRGHFLSAFAHAILEHFVFDARGALLDTFNAKELHAGRARLRSFVESVAKCASEQWARHPNARTLRISRRLGKQIGPHDNLLTLGKQR